MSPPQPPKNKKRAPAHDRAGGDWEFLVRESTIEDKLIHWLEELKYICRGDIRDRATLEANFQQMDLSWQFSKLVHTQFLNSGN